VEEVPVVWARWMGLGGSENGEGWGEHSVVVVYRASGIQFPVYCAGPISAVCCALRPL